MPAVGNPHGVWRALLGTLRVDSTTIAADDFDPCMLGEPRRKGGGAAIREQVNRPTTFEVHQAGSKGPAFPATPVVHAQDARRRDIGQLRNPNRPAQGFAADRDAEFLQYTSPGSAADGRAAGRRPGAALLAMPRPTGLKDRHDPERALPHAWGIIYRAEDARRESGHRRI